MMKDLIVIPGLPCIANKPSDEGQLSLHLVETKGRTNKTPAKVDMVLTKVAEDILK